MHRGAEENSEAPGFFRKINDPISDVGDMSHGAAHPFRLCREKTMYDRQSAQVVPAKPIP
jgi:hypothetical protein